MLHRLISAGVWTFEPSGVLKLSKTPSTPQGREMIKQTQRNLQLKSVLQRIALAAGLGLVATAANAIPTSITASVGGVPNGADKYENFDAVPLGSGSYATTSGITVSFSPDAQAVQGAVSGAYAPPFLSDSNGTMFGDSTVSDADSTTYLASGSTGSHPDAAVTLTFVGPERYFGLLWGSVDPYNTLTFYNGSTMVSQFTGTDVSSLANGNRGAGGTFYVNINLSDPFTSVVATSSKYAFEFDNVAFSSDPIGVPEPRIAGIFLLGLLLVGSGYWFKGRRLT